MPPQYDYEKIECFMQGVRDYLKFLKRGIGRTNHLVGIDIRNGKLSREEGLALMKQYDGKRPASLDLFLDYVGMSEEDFEEIAREHVVSPNTWKNEPLPRGEPLPDLRPGIAPLNDPRHRLRRRQYALGAQCAR